MPNEYIIPEFPIPVPLRVAVRFYSLKEIPPVVIARRLGISPGNVNVSITQMRKKGVNLPRLRKTNLCKADALYFREAGLK